MINRVRIRVYVTDTLKSQLEVTRGEFSRFLQITPIIIFGHLLMGHKQRCPVSDSRESGTGHLTL